MNFEALEHETPIADLEALGFLAEVAALKATKSGQTSVAVEVGSWVGRTALVLAEHFDQVFAVDHFLGNPRDRLGPLARKYGESHLFRTFARNMGDRLPPYTTTIRRRSRRSAPGRCGVPILSIIVDHRGTRACGRGRPGRRGPARAEGPRPGLCRRQRRRAAWCGSGTR